METVSLAVTLYSQPDQPALLIGEGEDVFHLTWTVTGAPKAAAWVEALLKARTHVGYSPYIGGWNGPVRGRLDLVLNVLTQAAARTAVPPEIRWQFRSDEAAVAWPPAPAVPEEAIP